MSTCKFHAYKAQEGIKPSVERQTCKPLGPLKATVVETNYEFEELSESEFTCHIDSSAISILHLDLFI